MIRLKNYHSELCRKSFSQEKSLAKALDYTHYSYMPAGMGNTLSRGMVFKSSLHMMRCYLKASHMCAIALCHEANLRVRVHIPLHNLTAACIERRRLELFQPCGLAQEHFVSSSSSICIIHDYSLHLSQFVLCLNSPNLN